VGSGNVEKNLIIAKSMRQSGGTIPPSRVYQYEAVDESMSITAKGVTFGTVTSEITRVKSDAAEYTYHISSGGSITGIPVGVSYREDEKTGLFEMTVSLKKVI